MEVFTLQPHKWYAREYVFRSAERHFSPIWVQEITPLKTGAGMLRLQFFHANYPEGVQDKIYDLQVVQRFVGDLVALRHTNGAADATVIVAPITRKWLAHHFRTLRPSEESDVSLTTSLNRLMGRGGH